MSDNVIPFPGNYPEGVTPLPSDPDKILEAALGELEHVTIMGSHKDGSEYFSSSDPDASFSMTMALRLIHKLNTIIDNLSN